MSQNYYYLVAGLPEVVLDEGKSMLSFREFILEAQEQLDEHDRPLLALIKLPFDNKNLLAILDDRGQEFDSRGNYSKEELSTAIKNPDILPGYMQQFLEATQEGHTLFPGLIAEDQLTWLFYDEMTDHRSNFIREWYSFDRDLRNCIAGINSRKTLGHIEDRATDRDRPIMSMIIGRNEIAEAILRSNAPDFGLGSMVPWADSLFSASKGTLIEFEKAVDLLRWNMLNDLTLFSYFNIDTILAFTIKLTIVERWKLLDAVVGRERLDALVEELRSGFSIPQGF